MNKYLRPTVRRARRNRVIGTIVSSGAIKVGGYAACEDERQTVRVRCVRGCASARWPPVRTLKLVDSPDKVSGLKSSRPRSAPRSNAARAHTFYITIHYYNIVVVFTHRRTHII